MSALRLVPLRCAKCQGRVSAPAGTAVLLCADCGAGFEVMEDGSLVPVAVSFALYTAGSERFYPFWTFEARLRLTARESDRRGAASGGLAERFRERGSLRFYCAAFPSDLEEKGKWSLHLTLEQPDLRPAGARKELGTVAFSQAEARELASDLFVTSELQLPDTVRSLDFQLDLTDPRIVAIAL
jgi:hypothetical protein